MSDADDWIRLEAGDDWGHRYLAISALNRNGFSDARRGLKLRKGETLEVRWPDRSVSMEALVMSHYSTTVSDMGNRYEVEGREPCVALMARGVRTLVPLRTLDVRRSWAEVASRRRAVRDARIKGVDADGEEFFDRRAPLPR